MSGGGHIVSYVIMYQVYFLGFADEVPYLIAQIELHEGAMILSNIVNAPHGEIRIGMPVKVVFEEGPDDWIIPQFEPAAAS